ncbi:MAG: hypothetical protein LUD29_02455 [Clostridia bacterium]|nr:hypothetical protein [Clostridia bacterium]
MPQIDLILRYQEKEKELRKIEREINSTPERKAYAQARSQAIHVSEELKQFSDKASQMQTELSGIIAAVGTIEDQLRDFENLEELVEEGADLSFYKKNAQKLAAEIRMMKSRASKIIPEYKKTLEDMGTLRKQYVPLQKACNGELGEAYKKVMAARKPERDRISAEMTEMAKEIDPSLMKKYEVKRQEKVFPIVVPVSGDRCSGCGTELTLIEKENIQKSEVVECENCGKLLYLIK